MTGLFIEGMKLPKDKDVQIIVNPKGTAFSNDMTQHLFIKAVEVKDEMVRLKDVYDILYGQARKAEHEENYGAYSLCMGIIDEVKALRYVTCKTFKEIYDMDVRGMARLFNHKRRFVIKARNKRYMILTKMYFGKTLFVVLDFVNKVLGTFLSYHPDDERSCEVLLKTIAISEMGIMASTMSFDEYEMRYVESNK